MGNMGNTMCTTRACQISFIFPQLITMWCRRQHILFYKIVNSVLLKKKKKKKRREKKMLPPKKNKTINNRRKTMMHAWTMLLQQRRITTIRWRIKPKTTTAGKWVTSSFSMFAYNTLERPPSQFCGVARQPKWDRNWGKRRKRKERQGRGGDTYQASVHSSGSAYVGLEGRRWPYPQRACCDREEAEEGGHFGSCHQDPWAYFEWAAVGAQHRQKNKSTWPLWKQISTWATRDKNSWKKYDNSDTEIAAFM